jgi:hypothetical protein
MALNLLRNARLFVSTVDDSTTTNLAKTNTWEIPILGDFTFTQTNETQDITVNEAGSAPVRGSARFNTALNAVEWSFSSYMRPYINASTAARSLDRVLWHGLFSDNAGPAISWTTSPWTSSASSFRIDVSDTEKHKFIDLFFYIKADSQWYKISSSQVNQAEIDFGIDTIGQITWSGFGKTLTELSSAPTFTGTAGNSIREFSTPLVSSASAVSATGTLADFIIQKYTTLYLTNTGIVNSTTNTGYAIPITGGTLTINNNMSYLTPENLGTVNKPYAPITGTREISGTISCYLKTGGNFDTGDLLKELLDSSTTTQTTYELNFRAGGNSSPYVAFSAPETMLSIPTVDVQDVISLNLDFKLMPYTESTFTPVTATDTTSSGKVYEIVTLGDINWTTIGVPAAVAATALVPGKKYIVATNPSSNTNFTLVGATASTVGTVFTATGTTTTGTGTAYEAIFIRNSTGLTGTSGSVKLRNMSIEGQSGTPNELTVTYYPLTTTTDTNDTN